MYVRDMYVCWRIRDMYAEDMYVGDMHVSWRIRDMFAEDMYIRDMHVSWTMYRSLIQVNKMLIQ